MIYTKYDVDNKMITAGMDSGTLESQSLSRLLADCFQQYNSRIHFLEGEITMLKTKTDMLTSQISVMGVLKMDKPIEESARAEEKVRVVAAETPTTFLKELSKI